MERIPASERTSQKLGDLLAQSAVDGDARGELIKRAVRKIVEEALEAEVADAVGQGYYENGPSPFPERSSSSSDDLLSSHSGTSAKSRSDMRTTLATGSPGSIRP